MQAINFRFIGQKFNQMYVMVGILSIFKWLIHIWLLISA
ncbi:putative membrane protein [Vibrio parahaemolyticus VPTS-2010]|nr:putative membrane protein [Vibrio parahaemolyticus VPTS-2010]